MGRAGTVLCAVVDPCHSQHVDSVREWNPVTSLEERDVGTTCQTLPPGSTCFETHRLKHHDSLDTAYNKSFLRLNIMVEI